MEPRNFEKNAKILISHLMMDQLANIMLVCMPKENSVNRQYGTEQTNEQNNRTRKTKNWIKKTKSKSKLKPIQSNPIQSKLH